MSSVLYLATLDTRRKLDSSQLDICDLTHLYLSIDLEVCLLERDDERLPEQTIRRVTAIPTGQ